MKKVAIVQSNYIPWKGYFDLIASVDEFILYDDVQYTKRDWRNRNIIKTQQGPYWLSIPVKVKGKYFQKIEETELLDEKWAEQHWKTLYHTYKAAPFFDEIASLLKPLYLESSFTHLSVLNRRFLQEICNYLKITTPITPSSTYGSTDLPPNEKLIDLCVKANANIYISGPAAKAYMNEALFQTHGLTVQWFDYSGYPEYPQLWGAFDHKVSIVDLLFNCGPDSRSYMKTKPVNSE
ncbi:hypothetical protein DB346_04375 [Verrucomicrobia bacterium LW23]|nr:hypothetical protein DB346_04375 [Verrucomicrobia bacterium LW23]